MYRQIRAICREKKDLLLYLVFGALTTLVNLVVFYALTQWIVLTPGSTLLPNLLANVTAILVAFATNRTMVFHSERTGFRAVLGEAAVFFLGRALTLFLDLGIVYLLADVLAAPRMPVKITSTVLVIVLNYVISKRVVFRKKEKE